MTVSKSIIAPLKKRRTLRHDTVMPVRLNLWLPDDFVEKLDAWRRAQSNPPTRGGALKELAAQRLVELWPPAPLPVPPGKPAARKARDRS